MTETYKYKSKIATAIAFIAAFISYIGRDGLIEILPAGYSYLIPIIVFIVGYILAQSTENKHVETAEQMIIEKYAKLVPTEDVNPATEYENEKYPVVGDDSDGC